MGFDLERHDYGTGGYPAQLVLQDVRTLHGSQFRDAAVIVASPPCQKYSYMAMPWKRGKAMAEEIRNDYFKYSDLNYLFVECFRLQWEASEAAGRYIPLIVENVRGAQPWVGKANWNYGSFYLWGDIPALMPITKRQVKWESEGSWFGVEPNGNTHQQRGPHGVKHPGINWSGSDKPGYVARAFNVVQAFNEGQKLPGNNSERMWQERRIQRLRDAQEHPFYNSSSKSTARKAASAQIAKIPFPLARWIAKCFKPQDVLRILRP